MMNRSNETNDDIDTCDRQGVDASNNLTETHDHKKGNEKLEEFRESRCDDDEHVSPPARKKKKKKHRRAGHRRQHRQKEEDRLIHGHQQQERLRTRDTGRVAANAASSTVLTSTSAVAVGAFAVGQEGQQVQRRARNFTDNSNVTQLLSELETSGSHHSLSDTHPPTPVPGSANISPVLIEAELADPSEDILIMRDQVARLADENNRLEDENIRLRQAEVAQVVVTTPDVENENEATRLEEDDDDGLLHRKHRQKRFILLGSVVLVSIAAIIGGVVGVTSGSDSINPHTLTMETKEVTGLVMNLVGVGTELDGEHSDLWVATTKDFIEEYYNTNRRRGLFASRRNLQASNIFNVETTLEVTSSNVVRGGDDGVGPSLQVSYDQAFTYAFESSGKVISVEALATEPFKIPERRMAYVDDLKIAGVNAGSDIFNMLVEVSSVATTTEDPTPSPTKGDVLNGTESPTLHPSVPPSSSAPTTNTISSVPTGSPTSKIPTPPTNPDQEMTHSPSLLPSNDPTLISTIPQTLDPTTSPTTLPIQRPTIRSTGNPTTSPTTPPTTSPTTPPTTSPTTPPTHRPTTRSTGNPTTSPTTPPTQRPTTRSPTILPTTNPTSCPTGNPTPTPPPTVAPTTNPVVFSRNSQWLPVGQAVHGKNEGDDFGGSVSLSNDGNIMAVGPPLEFFGVGYVAVFRFNPSTKEWIAMGQELVGNRGGFGTSLSLNGDGTVLAVGEPGDGYVYVFNYESDTDSWLLRGNVLVLGEYDVRHVILSKQGDILATGGNGFEPIHFFRYDRDANYWYLHGEPLHAGAADEGGYSMSLSGSGSTFVIGNYLSFYDGVSGSVLVHQYNSTSSTWDFIGSPNGSFQDGREFGCSVSLDDSGLVMAVGACGSGFLQSAPGSVYAFAYDTEKSAWSPLGQILTSSERSAYFGWEVSLSGDGSVMAVGDWDQVSMYFYDSSEWVQLGQSLPGRSVSLSVNGTVVAIGNAGEVHAFSLQQMIAIP